jgi:hypothetical protein
LAVFVRVREGAKEIDAQSNESKQKSGSNPATCFSFLLLLQLDLVKSIVGQGSKRPKKSRRQWNAPPLNGKSPADITSDKVQHREQR